MANQSARLLDRRLEPHSIVGLDTSVLIYHLEANARYLPLTTLVLSSILSGQRVGVVSVAALLEILVQPYRLGLPEVARHYEALLNHFPNLGIQDVDRDVARKAAQLRGEFGVKAFDALQVASAIHNGATAFITNDRGLVRISEKLDIVLLDDYSDKLS